LGIEEARPLNEQVGVVIAAAKVLVADNVSIEVKFNRVIADVDSVGFDL